MRTERSIASSNNRPLRVLVVAPSLDILGGQAVQASRLLARLKEEATLDVSFLPINPRLPGVFRKLQAIKYVRTVVTTLLYIATLLARVRAYDVIHVFSASYLSFVLSPTPAILIAKLYGKKVMLNYRSGEALDHLTRWRRTALPVIKLADKVVVPSGYLIEVFGQFGIRAEAIANTVDLTRFRFRNRAPLQPVILSNRNLESLYNVECILRAFAVIQNRVSEARLIVAGDGSKRKRLESLSAELRLSNIEFIGQVPPEKMPELYDQADIFINASNIDNMPVSHIEAFAAGLAVVTTDAGGIPYIVADDRNGLVVCCGDHEALARSVVRLLEDAQLAERLVKTAREDCNKYTWAAVREEWVTAYAELAGRAGLSAEQAAANA
ncbi:MAG TPA: glycosyltransferase family 4 protein [Blastocatellia bacterium]|nr:glycosyltransferase family 4 protein [Blastocatellia bacterium]